MLQNNYFQCQLISICPLSIAILLNMTYCLELIIYAASNIVGENQRALDR